MGLHFMSLCGILVWLYDKTYVTTEEKGVEMHGSVQEPSEKNFY